MAHLMSGDTQAGVAQFRALAQDEFAAIPRDMFWFVAIALLGETCALIGDREQAPVLYRLLEPHRDRLVQVTQAANLGSTHRFLALLSAAQGDLDARRAPLRSRPGAQQRLRPPAGGGADATRVRRDAAGARRRRAGA